MNVGHDGVVKRMSDIDPYSTLGISKDASDAEIKFESTLTQCLENAHTTRLGMLLQPDDMHSSR